MATPKYPEPERSPSARLADWQQEVMNGDTLRGFEDWIAEQNADDAESAARAAGWTTITGDYMLSEEGGWDGITICHRDHLNDRAGPEYGSWEVCCKEEGIQ